MCKFHKDVARDIATDPATGQFDPAKYSVALVAVAKYRIEQYMPSMFGCDGYNKYEMATAEGAKAFDESGLKKPAADIQKYRDDNIALLRSAIAATATRHDVSVKGLNLPTDPVRDVRFLDEATVDLFEGYTMPGYAPGDLSFKKTAHKPAFEPIRAAAADFLSQSGVEPVLKTMMENSFACIFSEAKEKASQTLLKVYDRMPGGLRKAFKSCAMCAGSGSASFLVGHLGCIIAPVASAALGVTGAVASSPLIAAGVGAAITGACLGAWYGVRGRFSSAAEKKIVVGSAIAGLALMSAFNLATGHQHDDQKHHYDNGAPAEQIAPHKDHHMHHGPG